MNPTFALNYAKIDAVERAEFEGFKIAIDVKTIDGKKFGLLVLSNRM